MGRNNCGVRAAAVLVRRPIIEVDARIRHDREKHGNARRGLKIITTTYGDELMRVLQGYGYALSSDWPRSHGMLYTWSRHHRSGCWLISVGGHFMAKRGRYWWGVLRGQQKRVMGAYRVTKMKKERTR